MKNKKRISIVLIMFLIFGSMNVIADDLVYEDKIEEREITHDEVTEEEREFEKSRDVVPVNTIVEFEDEIKNQSQNLTLILGDDFPQVVSETIRIEKNNKFELVIDGQGIKLENNGQAIPSIDIKSLEGNLTIKNINLNGNNTKGAGGINVASTNGKLFLENMIIENHNRGLSLSRTDLRLDNIEFKNNTGVNSGGAINIGGDNNPSIVEIFNSSFIENDSGESYGGYGGGAISAKLFRGKLIIKNSLFEDNLTNSSPTGKTIGGGGGAIFFNQFRGELDIDNSYFKGNKTNMKDDGKEGTYDGGAIYIHDMTEGNKVNISNTSFVGNIAKDDGGAILLQVVGPNTTIDRVHFTNNTFYKNEAHGRGDGSLTGGAIQLYISIGGFNTLTLESNFTNNTFYKNSVGIEGNSSMKRGGAIAATGGIFPINRLILDKNIFIGNNIIKEDGSIVVESDGRDYKHRNISGGRIDNELLDRNLGIDNGSDLEKTVSLEDGSQIKVKYNEEDIFGKYEVVLSENYGRISAGADGSKKIVPTLPIKPQLLDNTEEITADNISAEELSGLDQRGYPRYRDMGSVEMSYIKYNANKINAEEQVFNLGELTSYDGSEYYEGSEAKAYFDISFISDKKTIKDGKDLGLDGSFIGWSKDPDATRVDNEYKIGSEVVLGGENIGLYAIYSSKENYSILYDGNGNTGGEAPIDENNPYELGFEVELLGEGNLSRTGYRFKGWSKDRDGIEKEYSVGDKIKIDEDLVLYAIWEKDEIVDPEKPIEPEKPVDPGKPINPKPPTIPEDPDNPEDVEKPGSPEIDDGKLNKEEHFAYINGYPDETVRPEDEITREEVSAIIFRILDKDYREKIRSYNHEYSDISKDRWSNKHIATLTKGNIVEGYKDGTFRANKNITRAEVATMVSRFISDDLDGESKFSDIKGHWAEQYINSASIAEWVIGYEDGSFRPDTNISRAEFVTIINNMLERGTKEEYMLDGRKIFRDLEKSQWYYENMEEALNSHEYIVEDGVRKWTELRHFDIEM